MAGKSIRLGKAAGELNVGISTLTEFLASKGVKIDSNPNTKLESDHYQLLQNEFAADQTIKEQSKMTSVKREKRETISIRDTRQTETPSFSDEDELDESAIEKIKNATPEITKPETEKTSVEEVIEKAEEQKEQPKEEEKSKAVKIGEGDVQVQVVGKIDLDKLNTKTRPDKKKYEKPKKQEQKSNKPENKKPQAPKVTPKKVEKVEEKPKEETSKTPEPPKEIETIRAERKE